MNEMIISPCELDKAELSKIERNTLAEILPLLPRDAKIIINPDGIGFFHDDTKHMSLDVASEEGLYNTFYIYTGLPRSFQCKFRPLHAQFIWFFLYIHGDIHKHRWLRKLVYYDVENPELSNADTIVPPIGLSMASDPRWNINHMRDKFIQFADIQKIFVCDEDDKGFTCHVAQIPQTYTPDFDESPELADKIIAKSLDYALSKAYPRREVVAVGAIHRKEAVGETFWVAYTIVAKNCINYESMTINNIAYFENGKTNPRPREYNRDFPFLAAFFYALDQLHAKNFPRKQTT
jgi:hypothetical protein